MNVPQIHKPTQVDANWSPDHLGNGFEFKTFVFPNDHEGEVVATLVRKLEPTKQSKKAVLYVHGFVDYFFQQELAEKYLSNGFNFYALDLRKYGRSLRPHHTPNFCTEISEYFSEMHAAVDYIRHTDHNEFVLINGHSTGGLSTSLFVHYFPEAANALFLNSPFFDWNESWVDEAIGLPLAVGVISKLTKNTKMPSGLGPWYAQSIHKDYKGEWVFNMSWKPIEGFPVTSGWVGAIGKAQKKLQSGLAIKVPTLVMHSTESLKVKKWDDRLMEVDSVLDVKDISKYAEKITVEKRLLTKVPITKGMHDLVLSAKPVREKVYEELFKWLKDIKFGEH
eukprot:TRINITY_DN1638_c0_g1_i1.p1 TRINITY_DN1638_c0_g1~~TRINITY_DN1638_c0_g1_i1.p1  ORF type:complete len:336 (-),score=92.72 TRINITY_DN1638_c0_g1_i1:190-1197(-)